MGQTRVIDGRYELTRPIGQGGMGQVWAAYDTRLDREVAIKMLRPDFSPDGIAGRAVIARFKREARLTARLEHPAVPAVFDVGTHDGALYLAMRLVRGVDLSDMIAERGSLGVTWAVAIGAQLAAVLAAAHDVSLVHRDLKPRNIMLATGGIVTVLDFGVAALLDPDLTRVTVCGETVGSPAYMAPEQLTSSQASPRSDLYALGCILHEMVTGEPVFHADGPGPMMYAHLYREPTPLREMRADVPDALECLVLDLLAKDPQDRPVHAEAVYERLMPLLPERGTVPRQREVEPHDPTAPYRFPLAPRASSDIAKRTVADPTDARVEPVDADVDIDEIRDHAADLAEEGRFTQSAALLEDFLSRVPDALGVRMQFAMTLFLGGEYQRALPQYERLARDLAATRTRDDDDVYLCRLQAATCRAELGQLADALAAFDSLRSDYEANRHVASQFARDVRSQIGSLLAASGDLSGALGVFVSLLQDSEQLLGHDAAEVAELRDKVDRLRQAIA